MTDSVVFPYNPPARDEFTEIAPGVRWIQVPMPGRLDHTNVWVIDDDDGWALVDTGLSTQEVVGAWEVLIAKPPLSGPLTRVLVTHMHADHIGLAGWLTRRYGVRLWISNIEYLMCRAMISDSGQEAPADALQFYRGAGWGEVAIEDYRARFGCFGTHVYALPHSFHRLQDGMRLQIGQHAWEVIAGHGHSPEQACLYCPELKLLISGDHVLPRGSANVCVFPLEPDANPIADWFASMISLKQRVPDDVLVAPGHHDVFLGLHARIEQLLSRQQEVLERLLALLEQPRRVVDVFSALFRSRISEFDSQHLGLATGQAVANLNYLIGAGRVAKEVRDGVARYRKI
ncbi:MBL fold metallo-hydrolase [Bradyrhizobium vignae]|uniref:Beta-lactamase domain-containing protein n=1 Tax=Bradyrhizobium vignae TaxID=1549949 RepID=A0A2U3QA38_9BRAD|nr:MBL fold metallo-hydrolase [Bradyrhizobium vignae]SPP98189.1 Beta-lactamase domain-containing protein [Bradyrhizobium vignae]